jgi:hypothetical protein
MDGNDKRQPGSSGCEEMVEAESVVGWLACVVRSRNGPGYQGEQQRTLAAQLELAVSTSRVARWSGRLDACRWWVTGVTWGYDFPL